MGAVLQQQVQDVWQPLAFFSKKISPAEQKYSAYDRELLAIYEAVKYFRHMLEPRHFTTVTDHKPLIFAFHQNRDVLTTAVQSPGFHLAVHHGYPPYFRPG
jgi:cleavage and polyadenylation specificity factor subunit 1